MSIIHDLRGGRDNDPRFGSRMRGSGEFASLIERRFALAVKRLGLNRERTPMDTTRFKAPAVTSPSPPKDEQQRDLFE